MIRAVFFDFDGTLYDRDAAVLEIANRQFEFFRGELPNVTHSAFIEGLLKLDAHGHGRAPQFHHRLALELGFPNSVADRLEAYFRSHYPECCRVTQDTFDTLKALRDGGRKLGLITNGPAEWQDRKIQSTGVAPFLDLILISGIEGIEKPDPRIFNRALDRCGVAAAETLFVGDHPEADIRGAKGAGMIPVWKRKDYWEVPDDVATIEYISEILALIG